MATEKNILSRIQHKHDIEANWNKASSFIPKVGEIIIYDTDSGNTRARIKIGDGKTAVTTLPFYGDDFVTDDELQAIIAAIDYPVDSVNGKTGAVVLNAADVGADASGSAAAAKNAANEYTDEKIALLMNNSSAAVDSIMELAAAMEKNEDVVDALEAAIGIKANASDLTAHIDNKNNPHHVTAAQVGAIGLGGLIPANADFNSYIENGLYYISTENATTCANIPEASAGNLAVFRFDNTIYKRTLQIFTRVNVATSTLWYRKGLDGGWSEWQKFATTDTALLRDGSNAMTGNLAINKSVPLVNLIDTDTDSNVRLFNAGDTFAIQNINTNGDTNTRRQISFYNSDAQSDVKNAVQLFDIVNGQNTPYKIYGEHNKPSAKDVGAMPVIDARSADYDMDTILASKLHYGFYLTNANTLGTPYKKGISSYQNAIILSYAGYTDTANGMQIAFMNGTHYIYVRHKYQTTISDWKKLWTEHNTTPYSLGEMFEIGSDDPTDLNDAKYMEFGNYAVSSTYSSNFTNKPEGLGNRGFVIHIERITFSKNLYVKQKIVSYSKNEEYWRICTNGTWSEWAEIKGNLSAADVGAVALDGSSTMTGSLKIKRSAYPQVVLSDSTQNRYANLFYNENEEVVLENAITGDTNGANRTLLFLKNEDTTNLLQVSKVNNGTWTNYTVYHTGNLPTASSSTLGAVKTTSTVTSTSGLTACPIISGVPYYKNTTYSNMTGATSEAAGKAGLVPAPAAGKQASFLRGDGTWVVPTNTTYNNFVKSGSGAKAGLVPAPSTTAGTTKYLREDGTWSVPPDNNTTYSNFVKSGSGAKAGLVPAPSTTAGTTKYLREDGTWTVPPDTNTVYTHPSYTARTGVPTANATLSHGGTFTVSQPVCDATGHITALNTRTYTLPADNNTDTKVTQAYSTTSNSYPLLMTATAGVSSTSSRGATTSILCNKIYANPNTGALVASTVSGAVWNDYAEYRSQKEVIEPGYCVSSADNGEVYKTTEKFAACDGIVSDTFGFSIGETDTAKTPLAVAGRVLAYCAGNREDYHSGDTVCAGPEGKVMKMTREEIKEWPDRIIGIVSEIPTYETWGEGNVPVNGRIWIKVK